MDLRTYIQQAPVGERGKLRASLADALGVSEVAVKHWFSGQRRITAEMALRIESVTRGAVTREAMRPDIFGVPAKRNGRKAVAA